MPAARNHPAALETIKAALEPGESIQALHDFLLPVVPGQFVVSQPSLTVVLTDRFIHFMSFNTTHKKDLKLVGHSMVPISKVSGVSTNERKSAFGSKILNLIIFWDGKQEVLFSKDFSQAMEFANALKNLSMNREVQQGSAGIADELEKLAKLTKDGILTNDELARAKELFLGRPPNHIDQSIQLLMNLKELQKQGVLSESEFNIKKWDILSKRDFS